MDTTHKQELHENVEQLKEDLKNTGAALGARTKELLTQALIIGGSVALGYVLYRQLAGKNKSGLLRTVLTTAASALATNQGRELLIAGKNKVMEMLAKQA